MPLPVAVKSTLLPRFIARAATRLTSLHLGRRSPADLINIRDRQWLAPCLILLHHKFRWLCREALLPQQGHRGRALMIALISRPPDLLLGLQVQPLDDNHGDRWPGHVRLSDLEERFVCRGCGTRGADIRPDFNSGRKPATRATKWLIAAGKCGRYPGLTGTGIRSQRSQRPIGAHALRATLRTRRRAFCVLPLTRALPRVAPSKTA